MEQSEHISSTLIIWIFNRPHVAKALLQTAMRLSDFLMTGTALYFTLHVGVTTMTMMLA